MDRRVITGLVGLALVGSSRTAPAMQMKDPSTAGTVGYTPLDPIADRINSNPLTPGATNLAPSIPTDPTTTGPRAVIPTPPVGPNPVGLTPLPSIDESLGQGYPTGGFGGFFRRNSKAVAPASKARRGGPAAKVDPATVPSRLQWDDSGQVPSSVTGGPAAAGTKPATTGRPAPYANQSPDLPRRQVTVAPGDDSDGTAVAAGRPAPLQTDVPRQGRPRPNPNPKAAASAPRPRSAATVNPRTPPPIGPAPVIPSSLPGPDPAEPTAPPRETIPSRLPRTDSAELPPLGSRAEPDPSAVAGVALGTLPSAPEPPPSLPTGPTVDDPGSRPAGMPNLAPLVASVPPEPVVAPEPATAELPRGNQTEAPVELAATPSPVDPELRRTGGDPTAIRIDKDRDQNRPFAAARAAAVGDEIITVHQVETLVVEKYKTMTAGQEVSDADKRELINTLGVMALDHLIDQSLVLHEANHRMKKSSKFKQQFDEYITKKWHDEKLPGLLQKTATTNEYELRRKLADEGQSYNEMQENFRRDLLEHDFLYTEIKNKVSVDLVQLRAYYNEHIHDYDQPARINWREIEVNVAKYPDRAAARRQADAIAARLARQEDFATVAQSTSDGPTATKGGLYADMTPGAYGITAVNDVLGTIPEGRISPVIEAPTSFHIVRVESRRPAGPLHFDEVQRQVTEAVFRRNMTQAQEQYLAKLRAKTVVRVIPIFDKARLNQNTGPRNDPNVLPTSTR